MILSEDKLAVAYVGSLAILEERASALLEGSKHCTIKKNRQISGSEVTKCRR